jgi:hypothetical protein
MICGSRLPIKPPGGGPETYRPAEMAKLADRCDVVASGCGRRGSRGLICPLPHAPPFGEPRQGPSDVETRPATRLRATPVHRVADGAFYLTQAMGGGKIHSLIAFGLLAAAPALRSDSRVSYALRGRGEGLEDAGVYANSKGGGLNQGARCASRASLPAPSRR